MKVTNSNYMRKDCFIRQTLDIAEKVRAIIVDKLGVDEGEATNEANFINDLGEISCIFPNCHIAML